MRLRLFVLPLVLAVSFFLGPDAATPRSMAYPWVRVESAPGGKFYVKLVPDKENTHERWSTATVYAASRDSCDRSLWDCRLPWADLYLSSDGRRLAWASSQWSERGNVLEFHGRSGLIGGWKAADLLDGPVSMIDADAAAWRGRGEHGFGGNGTTFRITTAEQVEITFEAYDGSIVRREKVKGE